MYGFIFEDRVQPQEYLIFTKSHMNIRTSREPQHASSRVGVFLFPTEIPRHKISIPAWYHMTENRTNAENPVFMRFFTYFMSKTVFRNQEIFDKVKPFFIFYANLHAK